MRLNRYENRDSERLEKALDASVLLFSFRVLAQIYETYFRYDSLTSKQQHSIFAVLGNISTAQISAAT